MEQEAAHLRALNGDGPGGGPEALSVPLSVEIPSDMSDRSGRQYPALPQAPSASSAGVLGMRQPQDLDARTGAQRQGTGAPLGYFHAHLPEGFSPGMCEVEVPEGHPMAGQRVKFLIHPDTPVDTKTVLVPYGPQAPQGNVGPPSRAPGPSSLASRAPGPSGLAPPITRNRMGSGPDAFGHPQGFGKAAIFMAVESPESIKTVHDVKPHDLKLCYGGAAKKRWYFKIQENRMENNKPLFLWPICCLENCICDWTSVKYFDRVGYQLCCLLPCPGHFVSYKETIYCCFCCDCHCCYDAFCRPCYGEYVAFVPCNNVCAKRCCGLALPYSGLECIENSEEVAATINMQRGAARGAAAMATARAGGGHIAPQAGASMWQSHAQTSNV